MLAVKRSLLLRAHGALELHFCVTIIALAGSPCTGYGRLKVWIMWQVSHSQCGRETLAFFSKWFVWMLHSWVAINVLAGSSKKMRKSRVACDARALTHSQAPFRRTVSMNEINKKKSQFRVSILALGLAEYSREKGVACSRALTRS